MKLIPYKTSLPGPLASELHQGFQSMSVAKAAHRRPISLVLWHADGRGLKIESVMHDIATRIEVGALEFSSVTGKGDLADQIILPVDFNSPLTGFKLVISTNNVTVESGMVVRTNQGEEIVIVAGANPYTIAVKGPSISEPFEPEYELSKYFRQPI